MKTKTEKTIETTAAAVKAPETETPVKAPEAPKAETPAPKAAKRAPRKASKAAAKAPKTEQPVKKTRAPRAPKVKVFVEYQGRQVNEEDIVEAVKASLVGEKVKTLEIYVKPEDGAAYYVYNGNGAGKVKF